MKNRILIGAGVAALMIATTVFVVAQGGPGGSHGGGPRGGGPDMLEHISRALNLTEAQKTQAKAIMDAQQTASEATHAKLDEIHKQIEAATADGQFDEAQIRALANQSSQLMADEMVEHIRAHSKLFALLTPEQKVKAKEMHKMMGPGGPHGPDGPRHGPPPPPPPAPGE